MVITADDCVALQPTIYTLNLILHQSWKNHPLAITIRVPVAVIQMIS